MRKWKADENVSIYVSSPSIDGRFISNLAKILIGISFLRHSTAAFLLVLTMDLNSV